GYLVRIMPRRTEQRCVTTFMCATLLVHMYWRSNICSIAAKPLPPILAAVRESRSVKSLTRCEPLQAATFSCAMHRDDLGTPQSWWLMQQRPVRSLVGCPNTAI